MKHATNHIYQRCTQLKKNELMKLKYIIIFLSLTLFYNWSERNNEKINPENLNATPETLEQTESKISYSSISKRYGGNILEELYQEALEKSEKLEILNERINLLNSQKINLQVADARDYHLYSKIFSALSPDIVIHLAAVSHANKSNKDPHSTFDHSLRTLENTLDVCRTNKTHVIYLSSSILYWDVNYQ